MRHRAGDARVLRAGDLDARADGALAEGRADEIVTDLLLTPSELLSALVDHWDGSRPQIPSNGGCSLLAFARHALLEPVVGACALIWSTLDSVGSNPEAARNLRVGRMVAGTRRPTGAMLSALNSPA